MKNGRQVGQEHLDALSDYLARLNSTGDALPMIGRKPNISAIALACGFDRQTLYKHPRCRALIQDAVRAIGKSSPTPPKTEESDPRDKRIRQLEQRLVDLTEELEKAKSESKELGHYKRLYEFAIESGKDL